MLALEPGVPWREIARMHDKLTDLYFDTQHELFKDVVTNQRGPLGAVVIALLVRLTDAKSGQTALDLDDADLIGPWNWSRGAVDHRRVIGQHAFASGGRLVAFVAKRSPD